MASSFSKFVGGSSLRWPAWGLWQLLWILLLLLSASKRGGGDIRAGDSGLTHFVATDSGAPAAGDVRTFVGCCQRTTSLCCSSQLHLQSPDSSTENMSSQRAWVPSGIGCEDVGTADWEYVEFTRSRGSVYPLRLSPVTLLSCGCHLVQDAWPSFNQHYLCLNQLKTNYVSCPVERNFVAFATHSTGISCGPGEESFENPGSPGALIESRRFSRAPPTWPKVC